MLKFKMTNKDGKVLIIDDLEEIRLFLSSLLEFEGYNSIEAKNGEEGILLLDKNEDNIWLVLLDYMMPDMNGIETLKIIRKKYSSQDLPVIMVTAKNQSENIVECLELGANDYIVKPVIESIAIARIGKQYLLNKLNRENKEREERLKKLSELGSECILIHINKIIIDVNQAFLLLSGYNIDELIGKNIDTLFYPNEFEKIYSITTNFQGKYERINALKKNGNIYPAQIILKDLIYDGKKAKITILKDITHEDSFDNTEFFSQIKNNNSIKIEIDKKNFTIKSMGTKINLTLTEFNLVNYLFDKKNNVVSIDELLENVLKYPQGIGKAQIVRTHIRRIRAKLENVSSSSDVLINMPKIGYMLKL